MAYETCVISLRADLENEEFSIKVTPVLISESEMVLKDLGPQQEFEVQRTVELMTTVFGIQSL